MSELEDKIVELTSEEPNKEKECKELRIGWDLWDNIKHNNIWIIEVPEEEEKRKEYEKIFEETIAKFSPT